MDEIVFPIARRVTVDRHLTGNWSNCPMSQVEAFSGSAVVSSALTCMKLLLVALRTAEGEMGQLLPYPLQTAG
ncbi:hypothetical protein [Mycobacterium sp.]|uniref:hypothetical protein n=1 Tax=Mycobacterium sp. TaxID=1785 RepID=UPI0025804D9D|nr:hypothetical protein [Mycobacterium sp.]